MNRIVRAILFPPVWFRLLFGILSIAAVTAVFLFDISSSPFAYIAFLASALGLFYLITAAVLPFLRRCRDWLLGFPFIRLYYEDALFNARVTLYLGLAVNFLYAVFKLAAGLYFRSEWFAAIGVYYGILALLKFTLVYQDLRAFRRNTTPGERKEWRSYGRIGWLMLLMDVGLSGITVQVVKLNKSFSYPGYIVIAVAAYSFYRIIAAVVHLLKGKNRRPIFSAAKIIDVSVAVTAMFTLQTAMFASFSPGLDMRLPNIITGTAVAVIVTALAVSMIVRAERKINELPGTENG